MAWWVLMVLGLMVLGGLGYGAWRIRSRTASYTPRELPKFVQTEVKPQGPSEEELRKAAVQEEVRRQREEGKAAKEKQKNTVKVFRNEKAKPVDDDEHGPKPGAPASKTVVEDTPRPPASMPAATTPLEERPLVEPSPPVVSPVNPRPVRVQRATQLTDEAPAGQDQQGLPQSPPP